MPYKNQEDRTEAVKRHRKRGKESDELQKKISDILTEDLGFNTVPFRDLVKYIQEDYMVEADGIRSRRTGKLKDEPEVFFGLNMMITVETLRMTIPKAYDGKS